MTQRELIKALEELIARNQIDATLSVLRKLLKVVNQDLYRQVLHLASTRTYQRELHHRGTLTVSEALRHQSQMTYGLLDLLEELEKSLPETLSPETAELANYLLGAILGNPLHVEADQAKPEKAADPAAPVLVATRPFHLKLRDGIIYALLLLIMGAAAPGLFLLRQHLLQEEAHMQQLSREEIQQLADFYELTRIEGPNQHLSFNETDLAYWYGRASQGFSPDKLEDKFEALHRVIQQARSEGREILSRDDLILLSEEYEE
jgi:hypothetical protein